jgi:hypothetical protein
MGVIGMATKYEGILGEIFRDFNFARGIPLISLEQPDNFS